jgi:hypothetical protein
MLDYVHISAGQRDQVIGLLPSVKSNSSIPLPASANDLMCHVQPVAGRTSELILREHLYHYCSLQCYNILLDCEKSLPDTAQKSWRLVQASMYSN